MAKKVFYDEDARRRLLGGAEVEGVERGDNNPHRVQKDWNRQEEIRCPVDATQPSPLFG